MRDGKQGGATRLFVSEQNTACLWWVSLARMYDILALYIYASHAEMHVYMAIYSYIVHAGIVSILYVSHAQIPDKYIVQVSDAEYIMQHMQAIHIVAYTLRVRKYHYYKLHRIHQTHTSLRKNTHNNCFYFMIILLCAIIIWYDNEYIAELRLAIEVR